MSKIKPFRYDETGGGDGDLDCAICGKPTKGEWWVNICHETADWPTKGDFDRGAVSAYPVGPDCARKLKYQNIPVYREKLERVLGE